MPDRWHRAERLPWLVLSKPDGANELVLQAWAMLKLLQAMTVTWTWAVPSGRDHNRDCGRNQWPRPRNAYSRGSALANGYDRGVGCDRARFAAAWMQHGLIA